jgi:hypothetical protein
MIMKTVMKVVFVFSLIGLQIDLVPILAMGKKEKAKQPPMEQTQTMEEDKTFETSSEYASPASISSKESELKKPKASSLESTNPGSTPYGTSQTTQKSSVSSMTGASSSGQTTSGSGSY